MNEQSIKSRIRSLPRPRLPSLAQLLRWIGVAALSGAFITFLFQEWQGGNDLLRYLMLLGLTLGLGAGGLINGLWLKEQKGARTFLALALASLPVNFAVLGAFIYQHFGLDGSLPQYPPSALWQVDNPATALILFALASPLLAALAHFAFKVHARGLETRLGLTYLVANLAIAIPSRSPELSGLLALIMIMGLLWLLPRRLQAARLAGTFEGWLALAVLFLPAALLVGRGLWLYGGNELFVLLSLAGVHLLLRSCAHHLEGWSRRFADLLGLASALLVTLALFDLVEHKEAWVLPLLAPLLAAMLYEIGLRWLASLVLLFGLGLDLLLFTGLGHGLFSLALGLGLLGWGLRRQQRLILGTGALLVILSLLRQIALALTSFSLDSWGSLTAIGVVAVITASLLERSRGQRSED
ncbi:MAG: hypothetical protein H7842_08110 [Gammaproteobacteria bacterium SHHR-1]